jgi:hypothetical protein
MLSTGRIFICTGAGTPGTWTNAGSLYALLAGASMTGYLAPAVVTLSQASGSVAVNAAAGNVFTLTLTASGWTISTPTSPSAGQKIEFQLTQPASGGPSTVTWAGGYAFTALTVPILSTAASVTDRLMFEYRSGSWEIIAWLPGSSTSAVTPVVATLADAATTTIDATGGNVFEWTLGGNHTLAAPANPVSGQAILIDIAQPASGGPWTPSFASGAGGYAFGHDGQPTWSTAASAVDEIGFRYSALKGAWLCQGWKLGY